MKYNSGVISTVTEIVIDFFLLCNQIGRLGDLRDPFTQGVDRPI